MAIHKGVRLNVFLTLAFFALISTHTFAAEESITVTTYYPSPYGVYSEMRLYPKLESQATACVKSQEGLMFYDSAMHALRVCRCDSGGACILDSEFDYTASNYWTLSDSETDLYPNNPAWNVGIGTASPGAKLDIVGPAITGSPWVSEAIRFSSVTYPSQYGSLWLDMSGVSGGMSLGVAGARSLYIAQTSGNVGIGTTNPGTNKLDVAGTAQLRGAAGGTGLYVNPSGNVGIGTTNPGTNKLYVQGGDAKFSGRIGAYYDPSDIPGGWGGGLVTWDVVAKASMRTSMLCLGGSVGGNDLGTCRSSWGGNVLASANGQYNLMMQDDGNLVLYTPLGVRFDTATGGGKYGIPNLRSGSGRYYLAMQDDGNLVIYDTWAGWSPKWWSLNTWSCAGSCWSDASLKENIAALDGSLEKIKQLRGVSFRWKDKQRGEGPQIGLIAQEVEKVFPEVVGSMSGLKSVEYGRLVAPLIEALKEQQAQIEAQGRLIKQLQDEFNDAKAKSASQ